MLTERHSLEMRKETRRSSREVFQRGARKLLGATDLDHGVFSSLYNCQKLQIVHLNMCLLAC